MSKSKDNKGFKAGLESLLMDAWNEEDLRNDQPFPSESKPKPVRKKSNHTSSGKSFTQSLHSIFEDSLMESVQEKVKAIKNNQESSTEKKKRKPPTGLDVLIRRTVESSKVDIEDGPKRRVTFVFDEEKLLRLKTIAKEQKSYLKDIIGEVVSEFIEEYEKENGKLGND